MLFFKKHWITITIIFSAVVAAVLFYVFGNALSGEIKKLFDTGDEVSVSDVNDLIEKSEERQNRLRETFEAELAAKVENERILAEELKKIQKNYSDSVQKLDASVEKRAELLYRRYENDTSGLTRKAADSFGFVFVMLKPSLQIDAGATETME